MVAITASPPMSSYRKRFISCSGTYYIDGTKSSPKWYWSFILLFLILLFCFIVAVVCLVAELSAGLSVIEEFQKHCKNDAVVTHDQLLRYERYFNSFPDKRLDQICGSVTCFIKNNKTVTGVNNRNPDARVLGETVFSDWCLKERERYQGNLSADPVRQLLDSDKNIYRHVQEYEKFVHLVGYNDSASLSDKLVSGLVQWRHYFETNDDEIFFGTSEYNKAMNDSKLYEYLRDINVDAEGIHKSWLVKNRVFATELYVPDHVFFYNSSSNEIITDGVCVPHGYTVVKIYAIVLGFEGSHWIVQPVGQKWKQTSPGGIMKLADRCYKSNNFPRLFDRKLLNPDVSVGSLTNSDRRG